MDYTGEPSGQLELLCAGQRVVRSRSEQKVCGCRGDGFVGDPHSSWMRRTEI